MGQRLRLLIYFYFLEGVINIKYGHLMNMYNVYFMSLEPIVNLLPLVVHLSSVNIITFFTLSWKQKFLSIVRFKQ